MTAGGVWPSEPAGPPSRPDEFLAARAGMGDRDAFEAIVDRHGPALYRYAVRMLGDSGQAQDAVQDALLAAWRGLDGYAGRSSLRTWLFALTAHKASSIRRRRTAQPVPDETLVGYPAPGRDDPLSVAVTTDLVRALDAALAGLPDTQRACWLLVEIEGLTREQTAQVLHTTPGVVRGQLYRAR